MEVAAAKERVRMDTGKVAAGLQATAAGVGDEVQPRGRARKSCGWLLHLHVSLSELSSAGRPSRAGRS